MATQKTPEQKAADAEAKAKKAADAKAAKEAKVAGKQSVNGPKTIVVTQEFLDENPDIAAAGHQVGDTIQVEEEKIDDEELKDKSQVKAAKKGEAVAITKGAEFIRVYPADMPAKDIEGFVSKHPDYTAVSAESIKSLVVEWNAEEKDPAMPSNKITVRKKVKYDRDTYGEAMFAESLKLKSANRAVIMFY